MKITKITGCTAYDFIIDNISISDEKFDRTKVLDYLITKLKDKVNAGEIGLQSIVDLFPYESFETSDYACDQCGDTVETMVWDI